MLPPPMQSSLPAGWLAFAGRASNPLDRNKRFQITHPPFLDLSWRKGSFIVFPPRNAEKSKIGPGGLIPHHHQPIRSALPAPRLTRAPQHLAHVRRSLVARERLIPLRDRIEALDGIGHPVG